jgi:single-stranded DNA-specific DHH superfamily exonuclease
MTVYLPAPKRYTTLKSALDVIYQKSGEDHGPRYKAYIQDIGAREAALRELYEWTQVERYGGFWRADGFVYKSQHDAALHALNETEPYAVHEFTENDLISYYAQRGWVE